MGQSPFFYYNPEAADQRQHGHFSPDPNAIAFSNQYQQFRRPQYHQEAMLPSQYGPVHGLSGMFPYPPPLMSTPLASPQPLHQKALLFSQNDVQTFSLDSEFTNNEMTMYPATPPLSMSGSSISGSPRTCGELATPHDVLFFDSDSDRFEGVKEGCEGDVQSEILAGGNWTRCGSPPMTPVYVHPRSASTSTDLLSSTSCPSLSPSPSPIPQLPSTEVSFCDPRNLFVSSPSLGTKTGPLDVPQLSTLFDADCDSKSFATQELFTEIQAPVPSSFGQVIAAHFEGLPSFEGYSDLESDHDFAKDTPVLSSYHVAEPECKPKGLELLSFSDEEMLSEESFGDFEDADQFAAPQMQDPLQADSTPQIASEDSTPKVRAKKRKTSKSSDGDNVYIKDETATYADEASTPEVNHSQPTLMNDDHTGAPSSSSAIASSHSAEVNTGAAQPVTRRGRKQSLTDDPSKQFVCNVCNRRFRRQEHLKRHVRSLHTQEKPFECTDCGKSFSRSDNLAQHARTHGSGAIVMEVMEGGSYQHHDGTTHAPPAEPTVLGNFLFEAAQAAITSDSSSSVSDSTSSHHGHLTPSPSFESVSSPPKKRKRSDA